jgi:hypothetical protein
MGRIFRNIRNQSLGCAIEKKLASRACSHTWDGIALCCTRLQRLPCAGFYDRVEARDVAAPMRMPMAFCQRSLPNAPRPNRVPLHQAHPPFGLPVMGRQDRTLAAQRFKPGSYCRRPARLPAGRPPNPDWVQVQPPMVLASKMGRARLPQFEPNP